LKIVDYIENSIKLQSEQLSVVLGQNFLLTFQETDIDYFSIIRERIKNSKSRFINHGSDYLCHSVIDLVVDKYFLLLETFSNSVETLEDNLITNQIENVLQKIHLLKRDLIYLSKTVKPAREVIRKFETEASVLLDKANTIYIRDVYDHIVQINDNIESYRETLTVMLDIYISGQGNKLNEIMKILTIISTIFIPLTFLAGVYGMNFQYMPELKSIYGYPLLWVFMIAISIFMIFYFKRKKWF
jgi:magnesium transporter